MSIDRLHFNHLYGCYSVKLHFTYSAQEETTWISCSMQHEIMQHKIIQVTYMVLSDHKEPRHKKNTNIVYGVLRS